MSCSQDVNTSKSLVRKRDADMQLMAPPPPPIQKMKRPKIVLDEDTYTDGLAAIITRDFFPGLLELGLQSEYLDALESRNRAWIANATQNLINATPERKDKCLAPKTKSNIKLESPAPSIAGSHGVSSTPGYLRPTATSNKSRINTNMSLTQFQATYTSEDNESFYRLIDKQNEKRAEKHTWFWNGNKYNSNQTMAQRKVEKKLLESGKLYDDGFMKKDRLAIKDSDNRPAQPDTWKWKPKNGLMYVPDGVEAHLQTAAQLREELSSASPKGINYHNTRTPLSAEELAAKKARPLSPTLSAVRDALSGNVRKKHRTASELGSTVGGGETPRVNGYAFVESDDEVDDVPPIPIIDLGPGNSTPSPFHLKDKGKKEQLLDRMVDRIYKSHQETSQLGFTGRVDQPPVPRIPHSPRVGNPGNLTPAAQRLLGQIGATRSPGGTNGSGSGSDMSFAPRTPMTPRGSLLKRTQRK